MATLTEFVVGPVLLVAGVLISFGVEQLLRPRPIFRRRRLQAYAMHLGVWFFLLGVGLAIWQRPFFASALNVAGILLIVLVSNAKFASLREPFLLSDFRFFKALLQHPRLYLPFFGLWPAIGCAIVFAMFCVIALRSEPSILARTGLAIFVSLCVGLMTTGAALLWLGMRKPFPVTLEPVRDLQTFGLLGSFVRYWQEEQISDAEDMARKLRGTFQQQSSDENPQDLPHIVAVQCESFFDARRIYEGVNANVLRNFDALTRSATHAGRLKVPAWGANTVRTEFSFLAGIAPAALGVHQFNPYRKLARFGVPTIASKLKKQGYRTICVHPFSASFYDRDAVLPSLGFDEFIDITAFSADDKSGPYIGDLAVAEKIRAIVGEAPGPHFIFVITMENHGPLHQERVEVGDIERLYTGDPPEGYEEFTIYLRHLQHTDAMLGALYAAINASERGGWLCAYGDHVPILPRVYKEQAFVDGQTDYFVVGLGGEANSRPLDLAPQDLALCLLRDAGRCQ